MAGGWWFSGLRTFLVYVKISFWFLRHFASESTFWILSDILFFGSLAMHDKVFYDQSQALQILCTRSLNPVYICYLFVYICLCNLLIWSV